MMYEAPAVEQRTCARAELRRRCAGVALATVLAGIVFLHASQQSGRLASDLAPDDVGYAVDAAARLARLTGEGLSAFFAELARSEDAAGALRAAKRDVRGRSEWSDPFYWAPFVLSGSF